MMNKSGKVLGQLLQQMACRQATAQKQGKGIEPASIASASMTNG
jgi:hypothetical protein